MKILHTSDWHLGKYLEKYSRLEEQALFIDELVEICDEEKIDLIIIAGDIYDAVNPPIEAEKLFYNAMKRLSLNGERPIVIIAGNHDSPDRLFSPTPIMDEFGVFIKTDLKSITPIGEYKCCKVTRSGEAFIELEINNERAVIVTIPYITEKLLNSTISESLEEATQQKDFSNKVKILLDQLAENFLDDTINILMMHLYALKGLETDSERKIQSIGGTYAVDPNIFPEKAQYVALGHLHKQQKVSSNNNCMAYYSGSPIAYSKSEVYTKNNNKINNDKGIIVLDIKANEVIKEDINIKKINLKDYKPMYSISGDSASDVIKQIKDLDKNSGDGYIYIEINSKGGITSSELREIRESTKKNIVNIVNNTDVVEEDREDVNYRTIEEKSIVEHFMDFYKIKEGKEVTEELIKMLEEVLNDEADKP
ncbi:MAG: exonuclease subunit SbcD [bacterium]